MSALKLAGLQDDTPVKMTIELPADIKDESGRPLTNASSFPLSTKIGSLPPLDILFNCAGFSRPSAG